MKTLHPDHADLVMLALERLHEASRDTNAFPVVPDSSVRVFRALARSSATERKPMLACELHLKASAASHQQGTNKYASLAAALLHVYAPGVVIRRRRITQGNRVRTFGYWVEIGDPNPTAVEMLAVDRALESSARPRKTPVEAVGTEYRHQRRWISEAEFLALDPHTRAVIIEQLRAGRPVTRIVRAA